MKLSQNTEVDRTICHLVEHISFCIREKEVIITPQVIEFRPRKCVCVEKAEMRKADVQTYFFLEIRQGTRLRWKIEATHAACTQKLMRKLSNLGRYSHQQMFWQSHRIVRTYLWQNEKWSFSCTEFGTMNKEFLNLRFRCQCFHKCVFEKFYKFFYEKKRKEYMIHCDV